MTDKLIVLVCLLAVANARSTADINFGFSTLSSRIIGGHDAKPGQFPHQVFLQLTWADKNLFSVHFCGGSILNEQWILTAAHCLMSMEDVPSGVIFTVKAGKHNLNLTEDTEQISFIDKFIIHERFNKRPELGVGPYDIGLIKLKNSLRLNKRVVPISLPKQNSEPEGKVILSGWGAVNDDIFDPEMPSILQTINLQIVDRNTCNQTVYKIAEEVGMKLPYDLVDNTNVCSGPMNGGTAACGGDSGGPLISKDNNGKTEIVGIVSWGFNPCGRNGAPSVYTRASFFVDWIQKTIANN